MYSQNLVENNSESNHGQVFTYRPKIALVANEADPQPKRPLFAVILIGFLTASALIIVISLILIGKVFLHSEERSVDSSAEALNVSSTLNASSVPDTASVITPSPKALALSNTRSTGTVLAHSENHSEVVTADSVQSTHEIDPVELEHTIAKEIAKYTAKQFNASLDPFQFAAMLIAQSESNNQDALLVTALIVTLSSFDPMYSSKTNEIGLFALSESRALNISKLTGIAWKGVEELKNPTYSLALGVTYLKYLQQHYKFNERQTLIAFHWNPDELVAAIANNKFAPDDTRTFASTVQQKIEALRLSSRVL